MPRYIDADKLKRDLIDNRSFYPAIVKKAIEDAPIEDVVPRSEVEELKKIYRTYNKAIKYERQDVAREIFEEIEKDSQYAIQFVENHKSYSEEVRQAKLECYKDILNYIVDLKKKYIGE